MKRTTRLTVLLALTTSFFFVELIVGYAAGSIALVADSFHMLSDLLSICVALYAIKLGEDKNHSSQYTYGWQRAEILGALINGVFLLALCFSIFVEAIQRFFEPRAIENPELVLVVGGLGLLVNIIGLLLFHEHGHGHGHGHSHSHTESNPLHTPVSIIQTADEVRRICADADHQPNENTALLPDSHSAHSHDLEGDQKHAHGGRLNMHGVFLHVLGDALGSIAVIISAVVIWKCEFPERFLLDPIISLVITGLILTFSLPLVKSTCYILLQGVPNSIPIDILKNEMQNIPGVISVHELHVWQLSDIKTIASVHIHVSDSDIYMNVANSVKDLLHAYGIHSVTIQPEFPKTSPNEQCLIRCPATCDESACCPVKPAGELESSSQHSH
ncbi:cation efflux protein [Basidiobolus meristosporus CBS 931.73]|uniref:Cation efflux protein n=1 Tax=Basidiobolus meristosporus CBS 931.73 TaxID=1314790 RepID=A0A1Y1Z5X5_9FUNG|nr:cation efflux protein [Basidiobolus meristosporus CBS 931.73]|eukprot:ORY05640.1 cation efflux protein [Basidiobolus meristosporus CBS 931.73]